MTDNKQPELEKLAADLLAALAEIDKMRRTHNEWVSEQGERTRTRDEIIASLGKQRDEALELLEMLITLPRTLDDATVPRGGVDVAPEQVVFTYGVSLAKVRRIEALLARHAKSGGTRDGDGGEG